MSKQTRINELRHELNNRGLTEKAKELADSIVSDSPPLTIPEAKEFESLIARHGGAVSAGRGWVNWLCFGPIEVLL